MDRKKSILLILFVFIGIVATSLFVYQLPKKITVADLDMTDVRTVQEKKERFFNFLRPIIMAENQRILAQRDRIIRAREKGDEAYLKSMKVAYKLSEDATIERLLKRVDMVPLELVLAQSANESMWGQSRFAKQGNNLFGQYCYNKGCGIVPEKRSTHATHEVAAFDSVNASVRSYLKNINTHAAYGELRNIRKKIRDENGQITGLALADGLLRYSERGKAYVKEIKSMIKTNQTLMAGNLTAEKSQPISPN